MDVTIIQSVSMHRGISQQGNLCKECGEPLVEKNGSETCPNCNK